MSIDKIICKTKNTIISNPMHFIFLSNLCILNINTTNINDTNNHNLMIYDNDLILDNNNGSQRLNNIQCNITNTQKNLNCRKIYETTESDQYIEDRKLPFKKRKFINTHQNCKNEIAITTNHLVQNAFVAFSETDAKVSSVQDSATDSSTEEFQIINTSNAKNNKEITNNFIYQHCYSNDFKILFKILQNDLLNCLKNGRLYLFECNNILNEVISKLEKKVNFDNKFSIFLNVVDYLNKVDLNYKQSISGESYKFIISLLYTANYKYTEYLKIYLRISAKIKTLNNNILTNKIDHKDIFKSTFVLLQIINDDNLIRLFT